LRFSGPPERGNLVQNCVIRLLSQQTEHLKSFVLARATLWEVELEPDATGAPMTYMHKNKQYVVFAIGGQHPAEFVAVSLP
jgi:glucose dehydrogenase